MWKIVQGLKQGSPEWIAHRAQHLNASDAPAMMACHPSKPRSELVRELATGIGREFSSYVQERILDKGHEFEKRAGPLMAKAAGEEFFPVVGTNGKYSASYDGLDMMDTVAAEHKRLNAALREAMVDGCTGIDLPLCYQIQMEHQAMTCPTIKRVLFMASDWDDQGNLIDARHCWYTPNLALRAQIVAGWELLEKDVAAYEPPKADPVAAKLQQALPALRIEASGTITASNLDEFKVVVLDRINSVNMELVTDQDFAEGDADAKWLRDVSAKMKEAVQRVRGGMQSVDDALRVLEQLDEIATKKAIAIEKKVKSEKDVRKEQIVVQAEKQLATHINDLNATLDASYLAMPRAVFAPVIKGLKSLTSMEEKVRAALGSAQSDANAQALSLTANRAHLKQEDQDWITLFPDFAVVGTKAAEDFQALAALRIGNHKAKEAARLEAEREKIRAEEQAKAQREAAAAAAQREREQQDAQRQQLQAAERAAQASIKEARVADALPAPLLDDLAAVATHVRDECLTDISARQAIATAQRAAPPAAPDSPPTLRIGVINERLRDMTVTAEQLRRLGFEPAGKDRAAPLYHEADYPAIARAIAKRSMESAAAHEGKAALA